MDIVRQVVGCLRVLLTAHYLNDNQAEGVNVAGFGIYLGLLIEWVQVRNGALYVCRHLVLLPGKHFPRNSKVSDLCHNALLSAQLL